MDGVEISCFLPSYLLSLYLLSCICIYILEESFHTNISWFMNAGKPQKTVRPSPSTKLIRKGKRVFRKRRLERLAHDAAKTKCREALRTWIFREHSEYGRLGHDRK